METDEHYGEEKRKESVLTVPMRNGNMIAKSGNRLQVMVLTVPMRNGNTTFEAMMFDTTTVLTVPMRNGNHLHP